MGGDTELADGFYVAELMRREYPEYFKILSTIPIDYIDEGFDHYDFYNLVKNCAFR